MFWYSKPVMAANAERYTCVMPYQESTICTNSCDSTGLPKSYVHSERVIIIIVGRIRNKVLYSHNHKQWANTDMSLKVLIHYCIG
jgi:hypothetical protein